MERKIVEPKNSSDACYKGSKTHSDNHHLVISIIEHEIFEERIRFSFTISSSHRIRRIV